MSRQRVQRALDNLEQFEPNAQRRDLDRTRVVFAKCLHHLSRSVSAWKTWEVVGETASPWQAWRRAARGVGQQPVDVDGRSTNKKTSKDAKDVEE